MAHCISKASVLLALSCLMILSVAHCARNTVGEEYDDGRIYFIIDLNPDWFGGGPGLPIEYGSVIVTYTIEGEEPVSVPYKVATYTGERLDLAGKVVEGGTQVSVSAVTSHQGVLQGDGKTFNVDGNITLRFRLTDKKKVESKLILVME